MRRGGRSTRQALGGIVIAFELVVIFLGSLAAFGLKVVEPAVAFVGGGVICAGLILAVALLRSRVGVYLGWAVQAAIVATGIWLPVMFFVGAIFVAMWAYAMYQGGLIDGRRQAAQEMETE